MVSIYSIIVMEKIIENHTKTFIYCFLQIDNYKKNILEEKYYDIRRKPIKRIL